MDKNNGNSEVAVQNIEEIITGMKKFVFYLAHQNQDDLIGMEFDDIVQELQIELIKGVNYYAGKNMNINQLHAVLRRMLDNRISELKYRYYVTYRKNFKIQVSIDIELDEHNGTMRQNPEKLLILKNLTAHEDISEKCESSDRVCATRKKLSPISKRIFDAIILSDDEIIRSIHNPNADKHLKYHKVAEALGISERIVKSSFLEIRNAYKEVCEEVEVCDAI